MSGFRTIMYASDFSAASRPAFRTAMDFARVTRARLLVTHVLAPVVPITADNSFLSVHTWKELEAAGRRGAQKELDRLLRTARNAGVRATSVLVEGMPAEQIVRAAKRKRADLLVVGTHGRTGLQKLFVGSVASRVVATAACPVLTVHDK
jgi:nucleotide-binding universal stress UspA family protein